MSQPLVYDPRFHTFESWASLMVELYSSQQLEIPTALTDWRLWGDGLKAIEYFSNEAIPRTDSFENWYDWAQALMSAVNPKLN